MPPPPASDGPDRQDVGAAALAAGSVASGVFAYLYIAFGTRKYGTRDFSGVAQLWTIWFFGSSVLTFPLQHWVIQRLRTDGHGGAVRAVLPRLSAIAFGLGLVVSLVTLVVRGELFGRDDLLYPAAAGLITVGAAAMGLLRGGLAGRDRFVATATALGSENFVRLALGVGVAVAGGSAGLFGLAIVSGTLVILAWPDAVRFRGPAPAGVSPLAFLGSVAGATVIGQSVLTGGPVVLSLAGGSRAEITSLFTALALFRAPYLVGLGLAIRGTAALADLVAADRRHDVARVRRSIIAIGVLAMAAGSAGAFAAGRPLLRLVFGNEVLLDRLECAGLAMGSIAALATLALTLVLMAHGAGGRVLRAWTIALVVGAGGMFALPLDPLPRVVAAFLLSEMTALALTALPAGPGARTPR